MFSVSTFEVRGMGRFAPNFPFSYGLKNTSGQAAVQFFTQNIALAVANNAKTDVGKAIVGSRSAKTDVGKAIVGSHSAKTDVGKAIAGSRSAKTDVGKAIAGSRSAKTDVGKATVGSHSAKTDVGKATVGSRSAKTECLNISKSIFLTNYFTKYTFNYVWN